MGCCAIQDDRPSILLLFFKSYPDAMSCDRISNSFPIVFRPRMLVSGAAGQGQSVHLAPAALHLMEHLPVHTLSSATLFAASAKMPEEACANVSYTELLTSRHELDWSLLFTHMITMSGTFYGSNV